MTEVHVHDQGPAAAPQPGLSTATTAAIGAALDAVGHTPPTPTQEILRQGAIEGTVVDKQGRTLAFKKPGIVTQMALISLVGGVNAQNPVYMQYAACVVWVTAIDGEPLFPPKTQTEFDVAMSRIDEDGCTAIIEKIGELLGDGDGVDKAAAKN